MKPLTFIKEVLSDIKAYRRREVRISPRGTRGRIYASKDSMGTSTGSAGSTMNVKADPEATLTMTITRSDGSIETVKVPAKVTHNG